MFILSGSSLHVHDACDVVQKMCAKMINDPNPNNKNHVVQTYTNISAKYTQVSYVSCFIVWGVQQNCCQALNQINQNSNRFDLG